MATIPSIKLNIQTSINYPLDIIELGVGDSYINSQGSKIVVKSILYGGVAVINTYRDFKGQLVKEGKSDYYGAPNDYIDYFGFRLLSTSINTSTNKIYFRSFKTCPDAYNWCLKDSNFKNVLVQAYCGMACPDEKTPDEVRNSVGIFKGFYKNNTRLYQDLGQYLTDSINFCYVKVKNFLEFDVPYSSVYIKSVYSPNSGLSVHRNVIVAGVNNSSDNSYLSSFIIDGKEQMKNNICPTNFAQPHELTHIFFAGTILAAGSANEPITWLNEGVADYTQKNLINKNDQFKYICGANGWKIDTSAETSYENLASTDDNYINSHQSGFYATGACFWDYIFQNFGEIKLKAILSKIDSLRYVAGTYYLFKDIITPILGTDISSVTNQRFGINSNLNVTINSN